MVKTTISCSRAAYHPHIIQVRLIIFRNAKVRMGEGATETKQIAPPPCYLCRNADQYGPQPIIRSC